MKLIESIEEVQAIKEGDSRPSAWASSFSAGRYLETLFNESVYSSHLKNSRATGIVLTETIKQIENTAKSGEDPISGFEAWDIRDKASRFKEIFMAELDILPTFLVVEKEGYDINVLIESGSKLFPSSTIVKCPEAEMDMNQASKALAFELATACGFHIFRVTEAVLKRYWDCVSKDTKRPKLQTIANYAKELESNKFGGEKIWATLKQFASLHRNPLIHPEVILTVEEAIETLGIARSALGAMLRVMPDVPLTTTPHGTL